MVDPELFHFADDGRYPNSPLPLLVYRQALRPDAAAIEAAFAAQHWSNSWRNGIFGFHHFHSIAHEALGIAAGWVRVAFGGPAGRTVTMRAGDVVVIPAGVAHRNMEQDTGLVVVGAYPDGAPYDVLRGDPAEHAQAVLAIARVARPDADPVAGRAGGLRRLWTS